MTRRPLGGFVSHNHIDRQRWSAPVSACQRPSASVERRIFRAPRARNQQRNDHPSTSFPTTSIPPPSEKVGGKVIFCDESAEAVLSAPKGAVMSGAFVRIVIVSTIWVYAFTSRGASAWRYSPGYIWQNISVYTLDAEGTRALDQKSPNFAVAERDFRRVLTMRGNDYVALRGLARCYSAAKDNVRAAATISVALREWPRSVEFLVERSSLQVESGDTLGALATLDQALEIDPKSDDVYLNIGRVHEHRGEIDTAIQDYRQAIKLNDRSLQGHNRLAVALYNEGRKLELSGRREEARPIYEEVARELEIVSSIDPEYFPLYMSSGAILTNMGAFSKAEIAFKNAVYLQPENLDARTSLAMVQTRLKKHSEAIKHLSVALRIEPKSAKAHFLSGLVLADERQYDKALEHLQRAVDLDQEKNENGAVDPNFLKKLNEVKAMVGATSKPITSP
jgi:tetratricopeptide (TPR) repeat protein